MDPRRSIMTYGGIPLYNEYLPSSDVVFNMHSENETAAAVIAEQISHHELQYPHHSYVYNQRNQEHMGNFAPIAEVLSAQQYEVASLSAASRLLVEAVEDNSSDMIITTTDENNINGPQHADGTHSIRVLHPAKQARTASSSPEGTNRKKKRKKKNERGIEGMICGEPCGSGTTASTGGAGQKVKKRKRSYTEKAMARLQTLHRERMNEMKATREANEKAHREKLAVVYKLLQVLRKMEGERGETGLG